MEQDMLHCQHTLVRDIARLGNSSCFQSLKVEQATFKLVVDSHTIISVHIITSMKSYG